MSSSGWAGAAILALPHDQSGLYGSRGGAQLRSGVSSETRNGNARRRTVEIGGTPASGLGQRSNARPCRCNRAGDGAAEAQRNAIDRFHQRGAGDPGQSQARQIERGANSGEREDPPAYREPAAHRPRRGRHPAIPWRRQSAGVRARHGHARRARARRPSHRRGCAATRPAGARARSPGRRPGTPVPSPLSRAARTIQCRC